MLGFFDPFPCPLKHGAHARPFGWTGVFVGPLGDATFALGKCRGIVNVNPRSMSIPQQPDEGALCSNKGGSMHSYEL